MCDLKYQINYSTEIVINMTQFSVNVAFSQNSLVLLEKTDISSSFWSKRPEVFCIFLKAEYAAYKISDIRYQINLYENSVL
jgi:hypothetical protein